VEENQYRELIAVVQSFDYYQRGLPYRRFRPAVAVLRDPRAWWRFCAESLLSDVRRRVGPHTRKAVARANFLRRTYVRLYKEYRAISIGWFTGTRVREQKRALKERLAALEDELDYRRILLFRAMGRAYLRFDQHHQQRPQPSPRAHSRSVPLVLELDAVLWNRIAREVMEDYASQRSRAVASDPESPTAVHVEWTVDAGSLLLSSDRVGSESGENLSVLFCSYTGFHLDLDVCGARHIDFYLKLQSVCAYDFHTPSTQFSQVVTPLDPDTRRPVRDGRLASPIPFFQVTVKRTADEFADLLVDVEAYPLEVVWSTDLVSRLLHIFDLRSTSLTAFGIGSQIVSGARSSAQTAGDAASAAAATLASLQDLAVAAASTAVVNMSVKVHAPKIVIPQDSSRSDTPALVLDLGVLSVNSALSGDDIDRRQRLRASPALAASEFCIADLYRSYQLRFGSLQAFFVPDAHAGEWEQAAAVQLVPEFDMVWRVSRLVLPVSAMTNIAVSGTLPSLELRASSERILTVVRILSPVVRKIVVLVEELRDDVMNVRDHVTHGVSSAHATGAAASVPTPTPSAAAEAESATMWTHSITSGSLSEFTSGAIARATMPFDWTRAAHWTFHSLVTRSRLTWSDKTTPLTCASSLPRCSWV
jgi:hypothetical protein